MIPFLWSLIYSERNQTSPCPEICRWVEGAEINWKGPKGTFQNIRNILNLTKVGAPGKAWICQNISNCKNLRVVHFTVNYSSTKIIQIKLLWTFVWKFLCGFTSMSGTAHECGCWGTQWMQVFAQWTFRVFLVFCFWK